VYYSRKIQGYPYGADMNTFKTVVIGLFFSLLFLGCSSSENTTQNVEPKLVVQQSVAELTLNDQNEKPHQVNADTKTLIFAFSKDIGHACNDFFETKNESYLDENKALFIADVSGAPSIIRNMFILPGLKDFKHTVLVIDDETIAADYKTGVEVDKIIIVHLKDKLITSIEAVSTVDEMADKIEK